MNKYATTPQGQYHGPLPVRNFFPLPNIIFDLGLTAEEIAVYAFLMKCEDRRTYTCYPSYKTIGDAIGKSRNTVIKYVNMLEEKELITKRKSFVITKDGKAWNGNLIFKIAPLRNEQDVYYYQQMWKRRNIPYFSQASAMTLYIRRQSRLLRWLRRYSAVLLVAAFRGLYF